MSMRAHDLHSPYRRKHVSGPDPVNVILLVSIFALSGFLFYSVVTTALYVPVAGQAILPQKVAVFNNEHRNLPEGANQNTTNYGKIGTAPKIGTVPIFQRWDEKPPYVREDKLQSFLGEHKTSKVMPVMKSIPGGILQR